jgi:hypothetical protein
MRLFDCFAHIRSPRKMILAYSTPNKTNLGRLASRVRLVQRGLALGFAGIVCSTAFAQSPTPEEPVWTGTPESAAVETGVDQDAGYLIPMNLELDLATDEIIPPPPVEIQPEIKPPTEVQDTGIRQPIMREAVDSVDLSPHINTDTDLAIEADASVGLPDESNYYLPGFEGWNWFQMEGLKFRIGPIHARITLGMSLEYNTNIFANSNNPTPDYVARIGPTFTFGTGGWRGEATNFALLTYTPSFVFYGENKERDNVNENLSFTGQYTLSRYETALEIAYRRSNEPNATQRGLSEYSSLGVNWDNSYLLGGKTFARANFAYSMQDNANGDNNTSISTAPQLAYQFSPKVTVFAGPYAGIAYVGDGATQPFQGINVGITYSNLSKLSGQFVFGFQARQFQGENLAGAKDFTTPIFNFQLEYELRELTSLNFSLAREVAISDLQRGLTYVNNQLNLGLRQRLIGRLDFNLRLSYQLLQYQGDGPDGRNDQYVSFTPSLGYTFWRDQVTCSIFYRRQQLVSDQSTRDYEVNAFGTSMQFRF